MKLTLTNRIEITDTDLITLQALHTSSIYVNPKYEQNKRFGYSNKNVEQSICLMTDGPSLPIGMLDQIVNEYQPEQIVDLRTLAPRLLLFNGELRPYQEKFVDEALAVGGGQMVAPTGAGKTHAALALASKLGQRTLILVKNRELAKQWINVVEKITFNQCGYIGAGKYDEGDTFTVALVQSLAKKDLSLIEYGLVIADECHNAASKTFYAVLDGINARYKYGLSATPERRDGLEFMIDGALGPVCSEIKQSDLDNTSILPVQVTGLLYSRPIQFIEEMPIITTWNEFIQPLVLDGCRNRLIIKQAKEAQLSGGVIVLCNQVNHCELLGSLHPEAIVLHGKLPAKVRRERMEQAKVDGVMIIGTISLLSEGLDLPHLATCVFASPVSAKTDKARPAATRLLQSIGRCRRPAAGKVSAQVIDIVDSCAFGYQAWNKRKRIYSKNGFKYLETH